jgi:hypothetical protein
MRVCGFVFWWSMFSENFCLALSLLWQSAVSGAYVQSLTWKCKKEKICSQM